jgi:sialic acid synthase SpsE
MDIGAITRKRTLIIAEIGQNHQGEMEIAKELIRQAKLSGADAVKSQKRDIATLLTPEEYARAYTSRHAFAPTYGKHREYLELSRDQYEELRDFAHGLGICFFSSPWDVPSAQLLHDIDMPWFKVPSACLTHHVLLEELVSYGKPIIVSAGMSTLDEIDAAMKVLEPAGDVYLLQCTSSYPSEFGDINLRVIPALAQRYPWATVGFSGHHRGIAVDVAAVTLGARVIERHFTLDRTMKGSDHAASLEPPGIARLVRDVRATELALGDGVKRVYDAEVPVRHKLRGVKMVTSVGSEAA